MKQLKRSPIGIFDSGIGGLTVAKSVLDILPNEHIIYFGDTARVPYGIKSADTIRQYALQITDFLLKKDVKIILIACNTVAAVARNEVNKRCQNIKVLDVIDAGTKIALQQDPGNNKIAVIGTLATIGSRSYEKSLQKVNENIDVFSRACPLLVPLAEEGWTNNDIALAVLNKYLNNFIHKKIDKIILGCTHYPLFKDSIKTILGNEVTIIDSAESIATMTKEYLDTVDLHNDAQEGHFECYVSDKPQRFKTLAERFLGNNLSEVKIQTL